MIYPAFVETSLFFGQTTDQDTESQEVIEANNFNALKNISQGSYHSPEEHIQALFEFGSRIFNLPWAFLGQIEKGLYTIFELNIPSRILAKGESFPLEDTYCHEICLSECILGIPHVGKTPEMAALPMYQKLKLEAFLAAPIYIAGDFFGSIAFLSPLPRQVGFSKHERELIASMAHMLEQILMQSQHQQQMDAIQQKLHKILGMVAHDLRGPLGCIHGYTKMLPRCDSEGERKNIIDKIGRISEDSLDMVQSLLTHSALKTGHMSLRKSHFNFILLVQDVMSDYQEMLKERALEIQYQHGSESWVYADRRRMQQVLDNLIANLLKYAKPGSTVLLDVQEQNTGLVFQLKNQIAEDAFQEPTEKNSAIKGSSGLGLEIVQDILQAHETELKYENEGENFFSISFQLNKEVLLG